MVTVIGEQLIGIVRAQAAETPDFIYDSPCEDSCVYVYDGRPSCIVGHALWGAGIIDAALETIDSGATFPANEEGVSVLMDRLDIPLDKDELEWLRLVQRKQDIGLPWGEAVKYADTDVRRISM